MTSEKRKVFLSQISQISLIEIRQKVSGSDGPIQIGLPHCRAGQELDGHCRLNR